MFRTREVIVRLALEYFKRDIQIELREMRSQILHSVLKIFDVITSFSAVYIWSWTTAHRHPRTAIRVP